MKSIARTIFLIFSLAILLARGAAAQEPAPPTPAALPSQDTQAPPTPAQTAPAPAQDTPGPTYEITGSVRSGKTPLPGVTVTAANTLTGKKYAAATSSDGKFSFSGLARGRYVIRVEFIGFAVLTKEVVLNPDHTSEKLDAELILDSRQQEQSNINNAALAAAGRGFQSLAVDSTLSSLAGANTGLGGNGNGNGGGLGGDLSSLPLNGAGAEGPTESVSITGAQGRTQDFGFGNEDELQQRIQEFRDRMQREGGGGFGGGPGFGGPGGGGGQVIAIGRMGGRGFNINQPHGVLYFSDDTSGLDARPFSLTGIESPQASYNQAHFGANVGGPLNIPKIFNGGNKWFFFAGWNGSRGSTPYEAFSTVPTLEERNGNFSNSVYNDGKPVQIFNPQTGQPFSFNGVANEINPALVSPAATALLQFIPMPNIATTSAGQNFHYVTSANSNTDTVILRLIHNFGASPSGPMAFGPFGVAPAGGGGGGGRRRAQNNINFGLNWSRSSSDIVNPFPSLAGGASTQGLIASAGWVYGKG